ncbi:MAG TPA: hypothetical protein VFA18_20320, partial [Gemmataceae bacterium]|nr:hypothetical protein [Gemmataceae bacterium]
MMLTMAAAAQGMPLPLALLSSVPGQLMTSAHAALNQGIECYRQGNYEAAAKALSQAQASRRDLSANEQQELDNWAQLNRQALQQQTLGREQLRQAEAAAHAGQTAEADALLKAVVGNSYLSAADKQRALVLSTGMRPATGAPMGANEPGAMARVKLRQARVCM